MSPIIVINHNCSKIPLLTVTVVSNKYSCHLLLLLDILVVIIFINVNIIIAVML